MPKIKKGAGARKKASIQKARVKKIMDSKKKRKEVIRTRIAKR